MRKTLSIIIPYYAEKENDIFPLLASINGQVGVDYSQLECILVNDGNGNIYPESFLSVFSKLDIKCVQMEDNRGPGVARQAGIDHASGEYVMFCDADDVLHSVAVIGVFLQEIEQYRPDIITSPWLEEIYDAESDAYRYVTHENDATWMHGKVFRRLFLQTKNIRFHEELRVHEDSFFLSIALESTDNVRKADCMSYVWKYVETSITRRNNAEYGLSAVPEFIRAVSLTYERIKKCKPEIMQFKVVQFVMYNYFCWQQPHWLLPENKHWLKKAEDALKEHITPYMRYYFEAPYELICQIYNGERAKLFSGGIETEHINNWLVRLGLTGPMPSD